MLDRAEAEARGDPQGGGTGTGHSERGCRAGQPPSPPQAAAEGYDQGLFLNFGVRWGRLHIEFKSLKRKERSEAV